MRETSRLMFLDRFYGQYRLKKIGKREKIINTRSAPKKAGKK